MAQWVLLLQEFTFIIHVHPSRCHANADHLSRISDELGYKQVDDDFLDAHLFNVDVTHPEYAEIIHYLDKSTFPENFSNKQKQQLVY